MMEFKELVDKFSKRIRYLVSNSVIPSQGIGKEDLYQEILIHLWQSWSQGELEGKTDSYIIKGCYFYLKNYLRKFGEKARIINLNEPIDEESDISLGELIPDPRPLFDERIDNILFIQQMKEKELTRRENEVFELLSQGYTLRDIGKSLGISHVRVLKIKEHISKKFKDKGYQK